MTTVAKIPPHLIDRYIRTLETHKRQIAGDIQVLKRRKEQYEKQKAIRTSLRTIAMRAGRGADDATIIKLMQEYDRDHGRVCLTPTAARIKAIRQMARVIQKQARNKEITRRLLLGESPTDLAKQYDVHRSTVYRIASKAQT